MVSSPSQQLFCSNVSNNAVNANPQQIAMSKLFLWPWMTTQLPQLLLYASGNITTPTACIAEKGAHNSVTVWISPKAISYSPHFLHAVQSISCSCIVYNWLRIPVIRDHPVRFDVITRSNSN